MITTNSWRLKQGMILVLLVSIISVYGWFGPALADEAAALSPRLAADERAEAELAADAGAAGAKLRAVEVADIFGPSDEEKAAAAAAAQREQSQDANIATLTQQVQTLEDSLRQLTGQIEVINHRLDEIDQRLDRMKKEFDFKLCSLSAQQMGASTGQGDANAIPCPSATANTPAVAAPPPGAPPSSAPPAALPQAQNAPQQLAPGPGVLGTLPQSAVNNLPQPGGQTATLDPHTQFSAAMDMLARQQYDAARSAFRAFADAYPKDPLSSQALYWLGDIAYVQKDFPTAAHAFAEGLKKYPTSQRAPETMLKLGQALLAMDQKQEGCVALAALPSRYPSASKNVLAQAEAVRRSGGCHH